MKKKKGMTLMEIIVSCAIYAMFSLLICEVMTLVNSTMKATNQLNRRLSYESKNADNLVTTETQRTRDVFYQIHYDDGLFFLCFVVLFGLFLEYLGQGLFFSFSGGSYPGRIGICHRNQTVMTYDVYAFHA